MSKFILFFSCFLVYKNSFSQNTINPNLMTIEIKAIANQQASSFVATFQVSQFGESPEKAEKALQDRCKPFFSELQKPAIQANEYFLDFINLRPIFKDSFFIPKKGEKTKIGEVKRGVELKYNIRIAYNTASQLSKITLAAAKYDIYDLLKVEFRYNQSANIFNNLRAQCENYFKNYVVTLEELGVNALDWERTVEEQKYVVDINESYKNTEIQHISPILGSQTNNNLVKTKKINTKFYEPLTTENFDIVINRDLLEPNMQFVFIFKVHFVVPNQHNTVELKNEIVMPDTEKNKRNDNFYYNPQPLPVDTTRKF
jgi:hypothetical protein